MRYDRLAQLVDATRRPDLLVVANFSGGGSRAAAFAQAVLSELDAAPFESGVADTPAAAFAQRAGVR